jgi:two-component system sensor histidine kinase KdpD
LLRGVSHDLRTPIVAVMGYATTLMEMGHLDDKKVKQIGQDIYLELDALNRLTNNLLQITYLEAESIKLEMKLYSLQEVIDSAILLFNQKNHVNIKVTLPDNLPVIPFDHRLMQEVFINLLDNAIKFAPPNSPINIEAILEKENVVIKVKDRGPGIVPDEVNKLFEKFYRGRLISTERGLGLGLAICRNIIKAHGGKIWVENREGGGAVFSFTLPLVFHPTR